VHLRVADELFPLSVDVTKRVVDVDQAVFAAEEPQVGARLEQFVNDHLMIRHASLELLNMPPMT